jgi:hypothetical protein
MQRFWLRNGLYLTAYCKVRDFAVGVISAHGTPSNLDCDQRENG